MAGAQKKAVKKVKADAEPIGREIARFEVLVRKQRFTKAAEVLMPILARLERGDTGFGGHLNAMTPPGEREATRLASAITGWLTDPEHKISRAVFITGSRFKRTLSQVFEVSGYRGTGHLRDMFGTRDEESGHLKLESFEIPKLLFGLSINALNEDTLKLFAKLNRDLAYSLLMGYLSEQMLYHRGAERVRAKLLAMADHFQDVVPNNAQMQALGPAYMGCSYAVAAHKHDIKRAFNGGVTRWLEANNVPAPSVTPRTRIKARPTVVVFAEFYHGTHAMHRCYGPSIQGLKDRFHVVLMLPKGSKSPEVEAVAHEVVEFDFSVNKVAAVQAEIERFAPDMLYFPSVGMRLSSIVLSVQRFAPIQVMTFGHPATTKSTNMDYAVIVEDQIGSTDTVDETVILRPSTRRYGHRPDAADIAPDIRLSPDTIRIAVPAWSRKVTPDFLEACREIEKRANKPVEFWFFPNSSGALHQAIERRLPELLSCRILPRKSYRDYIIALNQCDFFLSSFPFGATNGIIDASLQGLPIVNLRGPEMHTYNDSHLVKRLQQPSWLTVDTADAFVAAAVRLANDDGLRVQISRNIVDADPEKAFVVDENSIPRDMADIFEGLYLLHDDIQKTGHHAIAYADLVRETENRKARLKAAQ